MIACLTIAPFAGAIERSLLPPDQISPLALTGPASNQIHATCEDAQLAGITVGMTVQASYALCPMLVVRPAHLATYQEVRRQIADIAQCATDRIELAGDDQALHCVMELGPLRQADAIERAQSVGRQVREQTGLSPAIGIATRTPLHAQIVAAATRPNHLRLLQTTAAQALLGQQSLEALEMPAWMREQLARLGWHRVEEFAALPVAAVAERFGAEGVRLHQLARGEAARPLARRLTQPHIRVTHTALDPLFNRAQLEQIIPLLSDRMALELAAARHAAGALWLRIRQEDGQLQERRRTMRDPICAVSLLDHGLRHLLRQMRITAGVIEMTALASDLHAHAVVGEQLSLWQQRHAAFESAIPFLTRRYGASCLWQVRLEADATSPTQAIRFIPLADEDRPR